MIVAVLSTTTHSILRASFLKMNPINPISASEEDITSAIAPSDFQNCPFVFRMTNTKIGGKSIVIVSGSSRLSSEKVPK